MIRSKQKVTYKTIGEVVELLNINNIKKKIINHTHLDIGRPNLNK